MSETEFRHSTLRDINLRLEAYRKEKEYKANEIEYQSWLTGLYVMNAIGCNFSKSMKYPENPLSINNNTKALAELTGKTEQELLQEEQYFAMRIRQANSNIAEVGNRQQDGVD